MGRGCGSRGLLVVVVAVVVVGDGWRMWRGDGGVRVLGFCGRSVWRFIWRMTKRKMNLSNELIGRNGLKWINMVSSGLEGDWKRIRDIEIDILEKSGRFLFIWDFAFFGLDLPFFCHHPSRFFDLPKLKHKESVEK